MLGARVCKARKVVLVAPDNDGDIMADPALDLAASDIDAYYSSLFDPKHLVFLDGEKPTWWDIRALTKGQKDTGADLSNHRRLTEWYIRCGLLAHAGWHIEDDAGAVTPGQQPDRKDRAGVLQPASADWFENMHIPGVIASALFVMIAALSEAQRPLSRPSAVPSGERPLSKESDETAKTITP